MAGNSQQDSELSEEFDFPVIPPYTGTLVKWGIAVIGLILLFVLLTFLKSIYTDLLWYDSLDLRSVYVKVLTTKVVLFVVGVAIVSPAIAISLYFGNRQSAGPAAVNVSPEAHSIPNSATMSPAPEVSMSSIEPACMRTRRPTLCFLLVRLFTIEVPLAIVPW